MSQKPFPIFSSKPKALIGFNQNRLVRDGEKRDEHSLEHAVDDPISRFYLFSSGRVLLDGGDKALFERSEAERFDPDFKNSILLGFDSANNNAPRLAVPVNIDEKILGDDFQLLDLRALLYSANLPEEEIGAIAQGASLLVWHSTNRFCGKCGEKTVSTNGGYRIDCKKCDRSIFPRTDPVVIMLAFKGEQCLLGRSPNFQPGWYSTLAGFVEPGETIEDAVRREVFEESGIQIGKVQYYASQPWPFPHSLMIGVHCQAISDKISFDRDELEDCRWFSRSEVLAMIEDRHEEGFKCPPSKAIASALIGSWVLGGKVNAS